jgi:hypothetical protein
MLRFAHEVYLCVSYDSHRKQPIISLNSVNQLIVVMEICCVFFGARTEWLNSKTSFGFRMLNIVLRPLQFHNITCLMDAFLKNFSL